MKKPVAVVLVSVFLLFCLPAAPYVGISQGPLSTSVEVGFLTRSIDQNLVVSLPLLGALDSGDDWYRYPGLSMNILYKGRLGSVVAVGVGPTLRMGWEYGEAISFQPGFALQLSLEAAGMVDIQFYDLAYIPKGWKVFEGTLSSAFMEKSTVQFIRFGYRHAF